MLNATDILITLDQINLQERQVHSAGGGKVNMYIMNIFGGCY